jgi:hypothetical protein
MLHISFAASAQQTGHTLHENEVEVVLSKSLNVSNWNSATNSF